MSPKEDMFLSDVQSITHSKWDYTYHVVCIPKYRKQRFFSQVRKYLGTVFHELARPKECIIIGVFWRIETFSCYCPSSQDTPRSSKLILMNSGALKFFVTEL